MPSVPVPVLVGVGQYTERVGEPGYQALSPVEITATAARRACDDALSLTRLAPHIDTVAVVPTFEDSSPRLAQPFGRSNNFPRSLAQRLGLTPRRAIWAPMGGDMPQRLLNQCAAAIAGGDMEVVLLAGGEAISTARHLAASGKLTDWSETLDAPVEDHRTDWDTLLSDYELDHDLWTAPPLYALCEHARRARLRQSRERYAQAMGELFAPFSAIAAQHPDSTTRHAYSPAELITPGPHNRLIADPYPRRLVARDQVNQGAALLLMSEARARALGIAPEQWIYLHGQADADERPLLERPALGESPAARWALQQALRVAGRQADEIARLDLYSCFPIAVFNACEGLGIGPADPRPLTVTGGLPYFGGAGNNYSMHAIATLAQRLRADRDAWGLIGANGGFLSKYSVGIYSARRPDDPVRAVASAGMPPAGEAAPRVQRHPTGRGVIETYTVLFDREQRPVQGVAIGRLPDGARFLAVTAPTDADTPLAMTTNDPLGAAIEVRAVGRRNHFQLV